MVKRRWSYNLSTLLLTLVLIQSAIAQDGSQVAYSVLIDNTGSLRTQFPEVVMISKAIVQEIHKQGPVSLFNFDEKQAGANVTAGTEWSQDENLIANYIDRLYVVRGETKLLDAINTIAQRLNAKANLDKGAVREKVIFVITDGEDRASKIKEKELLKALQDNGIKVNAIGLVKELEEQSSFITHKSKRERAVDFLRKLTNVTGGRLVLQKSKKDDIPGLLKQLFAK